MLGGPKHGRHAHAEHNGACPNYARKQPMKGDPLLWIAALAVIGCLLIVLASIVLKMRHPRQRERVDHLAEHQAKRDEDRS